jgi:hypothetical protein
MTMARTTGFLDIRCAPQRQVLIDACAWLIEFEQRSQRDGLSAHDVDRSLDELSEAKTLRRRLNYQGSAVAVPLGIVAALIDELTERIEYAAQYKADERVAELAGLLAQLQRLPQPDA